MKCPTSTTHYRPQLGDLAAALEALVVGRDPRRLAQLEDDLLRAYPGGGKARLVHCGVDIALHDLLGKTWGVPVHVLLGGAVRDRLRVCYPIFRQNSVAEVPDNIRRVGDRLAQGHDMIRL